MGSPTEGGAMLGDGAGLSPCLGGTESPGEGCARGRAPPQLRGDDPGIDLLPPARCNLLARGCGSREGK